MQANTKIALMKMNCPICNNEAGLRLNKGGVEYFQCANCNTLFSDPLDNDNMVGGGNEEKRNTEQNYIRIGRVEEMTLGMRKEDVHILDFGCGHGYLVQDLREAGYINTVGYDPYNEEFCKLPEKNKFHIVIAIEVIEHTSANFVEVDVMYRSLLPNGLVYLETSFTDIAEEEGIPLEDFFYIEPSVGHSTIFSHHGLDLLFAIKRFVPTQHFNRNARLFKKPVLI
jgi:SAM-dependent methyltransferase